MLCIACLEGHSLALTTVLAIRCVVVSVSSYMYWYKMSISDLIVPLAQLNSIISPTAQIVGGSGARKEDARKISSLLAKITRTTCAQWDLDS